MEKKNNEKKKNLIYIVVESYETSFLSKEYGGYYDDSYVRKLVKLNEKGIYFSNNETIGGAFTITGTSWTSASLVAQMSGLPLKISVLENLRGNMQDLLPGSYSIGEILEKENYSQVFLLGSDAKFGNRKSYFVNHGNYKIMDLKGVKKEKMLDNDYDVFWGYEDSKLFEFAKLELKELSSKEEPFNLTMLTVNTHAEGGYLEDSCPVLYEEQLNNVFNCTTNQLLGFIDWVKSQKFNKDTVIVITGDHISMKASLFKEIPDTYERVTNDLFINSQVKPMIEKGRIFTLLDMYPTTLAALGASIKGDRLGLGTNLFSEKSTLAEEPNFNVNDLNEELKKNSSFYKENFIKSNQ